MIDQLLEVSVQARLDSERSDDLHLNVERHIGVQDRQIELVRAKTGGGFEGDEQPSLV